MLGIISGPEARGARPDHKKCDLPRHRDRQKAIEELRVVHRRRIVPSRKVDQKVGGVCTAMPQVPATRNTTSANLKMVTRCAQRSSPPPHGCVQPLVFQRQKKCSVKLRPSAPKIHQKKYGVRQKVALIPIVIAHFRMRNQTGCARREVAIRTSRLSVSNESSRNCLSSIRSRPIAGLRRGSVLKSGIRSRSARHVEEPARLV